MNPKEIQSPDHVLSGELAHPRSPRFCNPSSQSSRGQANHRKDDIVWYQGVERGLWEREILGPVKVEGRVNI